MKLRMYNISGTTAHVQWYVEKLDMNLLQAIPALTYHFVRISGIMKSM